MKTVMQIIIEQRNILSQNDFDTWILSNKKDLLEKEKEQIMNDYKEGFNQGILYCNEQKFISKEEYYNQIYNK
jgi:hypothetical protein